MAKLTEPPIVQQAPSAESRGERERLGFFWPDRPGADKSHLIHFAQSFAKTIADAAEKVNPFKLGAMIAEEEWWHARMTAPSVIDKWLYEDVGALFAPGGTGKTTLVLFQVVHLVLGRPLFGHEAKHLGCPVIILTAEDSRETLIGRLRQICAQLHLTDAEIRAVRENVIITDVSGMGIKLTTVEKDVVMPSQNLDRFILLASEVKPSLIVIDPMVSFGVGESRVNDAEQGMIDAARRIRNQLRCCVLFVHHTGKEAARNKTTDQYSGRGGSALSDGCRMIHVLQSLTPEEWTEATGDLLDSNSQGFVYARPKMTWCEPQPDIYLKRQGYTYSRFDAATNGASEVANALANKVWQFLREELQLGRKHTGRTVEDAKVLRQKETRKALNRLYADGRIVKERVEGAGRGGAHEWLRPVELRPNDRG